jgi:thymidylate synthase (FAD)
MTDQAEIDNDRNFVKILDHGFVGLVDYMGSDAAIVQAARVSYGEGTKTSREDRALIRYLMRHQHTTPFEMSEVKFIIKAPIFVFRQLIRHRTASVNEYSARYSVMRDEFYVPDASNIREQSRANKQGGGVVVSHLDALSVQDCIDDISSTAYQGYEGLLGNESELDLDFTPDFKGVARETARIVLPVNFYSQLYWKQDLKNLLHLINLRNDAHAQPEIRQVAGAIYSLIKPLFPMTCEAAEDYIFEAVTLSRMDYAIMRDLIQSRGDWSVLEANAGGEEGVYSHYGISKREFVELKSKFT